MKIVLEHCYYKYHHLMSGQEFSLKDINLIIEPGQRVGIIGRNGAGKSTLLNVLAGLSKPLKGKIWADQLDVHKSRDNLASFHKSLAFLLPFPEDQLYHELFSDSARERYERILTCLRTLEPEKESLWLGSWAEFSRVGRRLLFLAMSLVNQPQVVILDEPGIGLDILSRTRVWKVIEQLSHSGLTIILASHELDRVLFLVDKLIVIDQGQIVACDHPQELAKSGQWTKSWTGYPQMASMVYQLRQEGIPLSDQPFLKIMDIEMAVKKWLNS